MVNLFIFAVSVRSNLQLHVEDSSLEPPSVRGVFKRLWNVFVQAVFTKFQQTGCTNPFKRQNSSLRRLSPSKKTSYQFYCTHMHTCVYTDIHIPCIHIHI